MKERILTCIVCPKGCTLKITFDESGKINSVVGNTCRRGLSYAEDECTHPRRTVTTTVRCKSGAVVAVKTSLPVPKELMFDIMKEINSVTAPDTLRVGEVIIPNILNTGADIVATANSK